jgi:hypothetical protein
MTLSIQALECAECSAGGGRLATEPSRQMAGVIHQTLLSPVTPNRIYVFVYTVPNGRNTKLRSRGTGSIPRRTLRRAMLWRLYTQAWEWGEWIWGVYQCQPMRLRLAHAGGVEALVC